MGTQLELGTDRRGGGDRVPLRTAVELGHGAAVDTFPADSIDLGIGGMAMHAACLPDVGEELVCRFRCVPEGDWIEAVGEVVWSRIGEDQMAQFGLRFLDLDVHALAAIEDAIGERGLEPQAVPGPTARERRAEPHEAAVFEPSPPPSTADLVRFELAGIEESEATRIESGLATYERTLDPFRLGATVTDAEGREGSIAKVELRLLGNTPMLAVTVDFDGETRFGEIELDAASVVRLDLAAEPCSERDTKPDPMPAVAVEAERFSRTTIAEFPAPVPAEPAPAPVERSAGRVVDAVVEAGEDEGAELEARAHEPTDTEALAPAGEAETSAGDEPALAAPTDAEARRLRLFDDVEHRADEDGARWSTSDWTDLLPGRAAVWARRVLERARVWAAAFALACSTALVLAQRRALPHVRGALIRARSVVGARLRGVTPAARATWRLVAEVAPRRRRRRTRAGGEREPVVTRRAPAGVPSHWIAAVAAAFAAAALGAYVLPPGVGRAVRGLKGQVIAAFGSSQDGATDTAVGDGEGAARARAPAPRPKRDPKSRQAKRKAASESDRPATTARAAASPVAAPVPAAVIFGAQEVPRGKRFELRMTAPVTQLDGAHDAGGFTVVIPGSLSRDPAGPIGKAHPSIERSRILNRGDHSELTIRFAPGKKPAYRVRGRGSVLEILVEDA